jgi:hypothetical protein
VKPSAIKAACGPYMMSCGINDTMIATTINAGTSEFSRPK